jgi:uncharacterized protein (TIGR02145 family)
MNTVRFVPLLLSALTVVMLNACDTDVDDIPVNIDSSPGAGMTDADGNTYPTVVLGNGQEWMAENLRTTVYSNGEEIPLAVANTEWTPLSTGARSIHSNDEGNVATYGFLYNWFAVNDERGLCPDGWHVPTVEDWNSLTLYLDPVARTDTNPQSISAGGHMKTSGTGLWQEPNTDATDLSGMRAVPSGYRHTNGDFHALGQFCYWWTSTERNANTAFNRSLYYGNGHFMARYTAKRTGYAVRCVKD